MHTLPYFLWFTGRRLSAMGIFGLLCFILQLSAKMAYAQVGKVTVKVVDELSREPLPGAIVEYGSNSYKTGYDGTVLLPLQDGINSLSVVLLGYEQAKCKVPALRQPVRLRRKYHTLDEVAASAKGLKIDELLRSCAMAMPENYIIPKDSLFQFRYCTGLCEGADTLLAVETPIYWKPKGGKKQAMVYDLYIERDSILKPSHNSLDSGLSRHISFFSSFPKHDLAPGLINRAKNLDEYDVIVSTFNRGETKCYDLILISQQSSKWRYPYGCGYLGRHPAKSKGLLTACSCNLMRRLTVYTCIRALMLICHRRNYNSCYNRKTKHFFAMNCWLLSTVPPVARCTRLHLPKPAKAGS